MEPIKIGLVGLGHRGLHWLRHLQSIEGYCVTALCDPIVALHEHALAAVENPGQVVAYARYEDLLADKNVDAVALCVRCREQGLLAALALEAGKHVNAEVPASHTLEDCWRIVVAVEKSGRIYQLAEQTRYWGFIDAWRELVASGQLGHITFCEGQYIGYYGTRQFFQDRADGAFCGVEQLEAHPQAQPTWLHTMPLASSTWAPKKALCVCGPPSTRLQVWPANCCPLSAAQRPTPQLPKPAFLPICPTRVATTTRASVR